MAPDVVGPVSMPGAGGSRARRAGLGLLLHLAVCSSNGTPPSGSARLAAVRGLSPPPSDDEDPTVRFRASQRALRAAPAIIEEVSEKYLKPGVTNLAAGFAYWPPPDACVEEAQRLLKENPAELHRYGACLGLPELREMLKTKLQKENGIRNREIMVTAGANMAFVNVAMCLCNPGDSAVLFTPYYFSHRVALELHGIKPLYVECDDDLVPSAHKLQVSADVYVRPRSVPAREESVPWRREAACVVVQKPLLHSSRTQAPGGVLQCTRAPKDPHAHTHTHTRRRRCGLLQKTVSR